MFYVFLYFMFQSVSSCALITHGSSFLIIPPAVPVSSLSHVHILFRELKKKLNSLSPVYHFTCLHLGRISNLSPSTFSQLYLWTPSSVFATIHTHFHFLFFSKRKPCVWAEQSPSLGDSFRVSTWKMLLVISLDNGQNDPKVEEGGEINSHECKWAEKDLLLWFWFQILNLCLLLWRSIQQFLQAHN